MEGGEGGVLGTVTILMHEVGVPMIECGGEIEAQVCLGLEGLHGVRSMGGNTAVVVAKKRLVERGDIVWRRRL